MTSHDKGGEQSTPPGHIPTSRRDPLALRTLAPEFSDSRHGVYVHALVHAIEHEPTMRNIALTGAYGTGKSSVLARVAELFPSRVLELSLSTVGEDEDREANEQVNSGSDVNPASTTKVNRIQKEIVKQILYRDEPFRTRGSRFRRIAHFNVKRETGFALASAALILAMLFLTRLNVPLVAVAGDNLPALLFAHLGLFTVITCVVGGLRWLTHNQVFLEKFSAGPATVSLSAQSSSYFDQYMDEIVYYFEQSGRDVVIFEDIDRFNDVHIFETLRALNTLLNGSEQVRRRRGRGQPQQRKTEPFERVPDVKFIYALRDSVFEKIGFEKGKEQTTDAAEKEVGRANRTKFFDLVVPIVPFITHRNARDLMIEEMEGTGVSRTLTDIAARHVADKRLITNMRNEYDVFAQKLLGTENQMPGLDPDYLFAMILYKSVHMADFEAIRFGTSNLDLLHAAWRSLVETNIDAAVSRENNADKKLATLDSIADRAKGLGDRLEQVAKLMTLGPYSEHRQVTVDSGQVESSDLRTPNFWRKVIVDKKQVAIGTPQRGMTSYSCANLQTLLGRSLDASTWEKVDRQHILRQRDAARADVQFLRHHSWNEIQARPDFTLSKKAGDTEGGQESFAQFSERLLESRLARALVASGYINDYFALYISIYYGTHLRLDALNFIVHALDQGQTDMLYALEPDDVAAILNDKGEGVLNDSSAYNVSILDYLLASGQRRSQAEIVVEQVAAWERDDEVFANRYMSNGTQLTKFIELLAAHKDTIMTYVAEDAPLDDERRVELLDVAMSHLSADLTYATSDEVADLVLGSYSDFPSLTSAELNLHKPTTMSAIATMELELPSVAPLNDFARNAAIKFETYAVNEVNLAYLTGQSSIALDVLHGKNERVYKTVLARMPTYLDAVRSAEPAQYTVDEQTKFVNVLADVDSATPDDAIALSEVVRLADHACTISDLATAPPRAWAEIVFGLRTSATAKNLLAYLDEVGHIDGYIAHLLADVECVKDAKGVAQTDRTRLAVSILAAADHLPDAAHRVGLAASLDPEAPLSVAALKPESGPFVGLLIDANLIADDETTFSSALIPDWTSREFAIKKSANIEDFLKPTVLPGTQLQDFFSSTVIATPLKEAVLTDLSGYIAGATPADYEATAQFALDSRAQLTLTQLEVLRSGGTSTVSLIALAASSRLVQTDELRSLLRSVGSIYAVIVDPGTGRPLVPDDQLHRDILQRLQDVGVVSNYKAEKGQLRVSLRKS